MRHERVVVGMAAERGLEYGIALLEALRELGAEAHVVVTAAAEAALGVDAERVRSLATRQYGEGNQAARISSGSFLTRGMIVSPCDLRGLAAIATGVASNLVFRAADVTLKERRPLVLGLVERAATSLERDVLARATRVPGLVAVSLGGPPEAAAADLLDQLELESGASA